MQLKQLGDRFRDECHCFEIAEYVHEDATANAIKPTAGIGSVDLNSV